MGFRFRKSFKIAPGIKLNLGKKSIGVGFGGRRGGVSFNTRSGAKGVGFLFQEPDCPIQPR